MSSDSSPWVPKEKKVILRVLKAFQPCEEYFNFYERVMCATSPPERTSIYKIFFLEHQQYSHDNFKKEKKN